MRAVQSPDKNMHSILRAQYELKEATADELEGHYASFGEKDK